MHPKIRHLLHQRHLLRDFLERDLQAKYVGSVGGFLWAVAQPLFLLLVYTFVFSVILQVRFGQEGSLTAFALYLYCGMLPWNAFASAVSRSTPSLAENRNLIRNTRFPAKVLPTTIVLSELVAQAIGVLVLLGALIVVGHPIGWTVLLLPVLVVFQLGFTLGMSYALSTLQVFFRDTAHLVGVVLPVWMFLTPLFYPEERVPERFRWVVDVNPMSHLVRMYRQTVLERQVFQAWDLLFFGGFAVAVFLGGYFLFTRNHWKLVDLV